MKVMRNKTIWLSAAAVLLVSVAGVVMVRKHGDMPAPARVEANVLETGPAIGDAEAMRAIADAGVAIDGLSVKSAGGIYIIRGSGVPAAGEQAVTVLRGLGVTRVANLVTPARAWNDDQIRRDAERELASRSALNGAKFTVRCDRGVITVSGTVQHELQKDLARATLASIRGVREIKIDLARL